MSSQGQDLVIQAGSIGILAPNIDHDYGILASESHWEQLWFHWVPSASYENLLRQLLHQEQVKVIAVQNPRDSEELLRQAIQTQSGTLGSLSAINLIERFVLNLVENHDVQQPPTKTAQALEVISRHYSENLSIDEIAAKVGLSASRLTGLFRTELGITPRRAVERERLNQAKHLLRMSNRSIQSISEQLGFASPFYFTLRFRKETGMSPTEFRQKA